MQKIYLDTSTISCLQVDDYRQGISNDFWDVLKSGNYEIFISATVLKELGECPEPKRTYLFARLTELEYITLTPSEEVMELAQIYIDNKVLPPASMADAEHIAYAVIEKCDMLVSWNFNHLVNPKTISGVRYINAVNNYAEMGIYSPEMVLGGLDEEVKNG